MRALVASLLFFAPLAARAEPAAEAACAEKAIEDRCSYVCEDCLTPGATVCGGCAASCSEVDDVPDAGPPCDSLDGDACAARADCAAIVRCFGAPTLCEDDAGEDEPACAATRTSTDVPAAALAVVLAALAPLARRGGRLTDAASSPRRSASA